MSQVVAEQPRLMSGFNAPPINPYSARVAAALAAVETPNTETSTPPVPPAAPPVAPPPAGEINLPFVIPAPVVQTATTPPPAATPPVPPVPPVAPVLAPVQEDPRLAMALEAIERERQQHAQEIAQQQQAIQVLAKEREELAALKQRAQLQAAISNEAFAELETVDAKDAERISAAVLNATQSVLAPLQKEIENVQARTSAQFVQQQQLERQRAAAQVTSRITQVHPDFHTLLTHPTYQNFMSQRDGLSSLTRDQRAAQEFEAGNAEYIIDLLNQMKGTAPQTAQIVTVAPVQTATATAPVQEAPPSLTLREINRLYQTGQITLEEHNKLAPKARASLYQS